MLRVLRMLWGASARELLVIWRWVKIGFWFASSCYCAWFTFHFWQKFDGLAHFGFVFYVLSGFGNAWNVYRGAET